MNISKRSYPEGVKIDNEAGRKQKKTNVTHRHDKIIIFFVI
jgi:hypothetical protein